MFNRAKSISFQIDFHDINTKGTCRRWKFSNCSANAFARTFNFNYWNCQRVSNEKMLWALECNFVFFSFQQMHFSAQKVFSLLHVAAEFRWWRWFAKYANTRDTNSKETGKKNENWKKRGVWCGGEWRNSLLYCLLLNIVSFGSLQNTYLNNFAPCK